jgi:hypothetical protein
MRAKTATRIRDAIRRKMRLQRRTISPQRDFPENFFIAKKRDSESAIAVFGRLRRLAVADACCIYLISRISVMLVVQSLPTILTNADVEFPRVSAIVRIRAVVLSLRAWCARRHRVINTSLSGTLFFLMCWCIRDVVHLDSRVHAATSDHFHSGGQHGQES